MKVQDFLVKYGTRAVPMIIRELAARRKGSEAALEAARDLQAMLEELVAENELLGLTVGEVMRRGMNGKGGEG